MSDNTDKSRGPQFQNVPVKVADPSGNTYLSPIPSRDASSWSEFVKSQQPPPLSPREALELERVQAEEAARAEQVRSKQREERCRATLGVIKAFHAEVTAAAAAAMKPGPPVPWHHRLAARWILHGGGQYGPAWGGGHQDLMLEQLFLLRDKARSWYAGTLPDMDAACVSALDAAEMACNRALVEYAKRISGEA